MRKSLKMKLLRTVGFMAKQRIKVKNKLGKNMKKRVSSFMLF